MQGVHGKGGLADADAAVIGRQQAVQQHAEARALEALLCQPRQQGVLEDAAAQGDRGDACLLARSLAACANHCGERIVEVVGERFGRAALLVQSS